MLLAFGTTQKPQPLDPPERHGHGLRGQRAGGPVHPRGDGDRHRGRACSSCTASRGSAWPPGPRPRTSSPPCSPGCRRTSCRWSTRCWRASCAGTVGVLAASVTQLDAVSLPLQVVPALAAALLARLTSFAIACAVGLGIGIVNSLIDYVSTQVVVPDRPRRAAAGRQGAGRLPDHHHGDVPARGGAARTRRADRAAAARGAQARSGWRPRDRHRRSSARWRWWCSRSTSARR